MTVEGQQYTAAEVALRNGKSMKDVWIVIDNVVYDVTSFLGGNHPGGDDLITDWAGMDATSEFELAGHSSEAMKDLKKLRIGILVSGNPAILSINEKKALEAEGWNHDRYQDKKQTKKRKCFIFC